MINANTDVKTERFMGVRRIGVGVLGMAGEQQGGFHKKLMPGLSHP